MFNIKDNIFSYIAKKSELTNGLAQLYQNSLIFIGDEQQIYQPLINTYIGIGMTAYNNLSNVVKYKSDKLYITDELNDDEIRYFPVLKNADSGLYHYAYITDTIAVNPGKKLFIGNLSGTSYTSSYSYIYANSNDENLPLIFTKTSNSNNNTIYKDSGNSIFYNPSKNSFGHGNNVIASGNNSTAEGNTTTASGLDSHAEGASTTASGEQAHSEGAITKAKGKNSHAEGRSTIAYGDMSHAEGNNSISYGDYSHSEGNNNITYGLYSHGEGKDNMTYGDYSHVGGLNSVAYSNAGFTHGEGLISNNLYEVTFGKYNKSNNNSNTRFSIGNGTSNTNRSNLFEVRENGCAYAETFVGDLNGTARWAEHATYSTYTTYTTYASYSLHNTYQSIHSISSDHNYYITFSYNASYSLSYVDTDFYYNPATNAIYNNGNSYSQGYKHLGIDNDNYVLTAGGSYKQWSISNTANTLVARDESKNIYVNDINTTADNLNSTSFTKVYVSDGDWIKYVTKSKFIEAINKEDTIVFENILLRVTEAWMDSGVSIDPSIFKGSGTYAIQISHGNLPFPTVNGYASIYSGVISIYADGTNSTTDSEEVILHRSGYAGGSRLYIRTMPVLNSGACKIQIAASKTWTDAANITFKFRKLI